MAKVTEIAKDYFNPYGGFYGNNAKGHSHAASSNPIHLPRQAALQKGWADRPLRWLFIDFNSFFASVEQHLKPELQGQPLIVVPMLTDSTCAIAASYEARAYGIKTGTPVWEAKKRCPDLKITMARHQEYVEMHHRLQEVVESCIPVTMVCSIDEFACQLMDNEQDPAFARQLALNIKTAIKQEIGTSLRCSIGIGPNRWLAKQGTELQKPDGLVVLEAASLPGALLNMKLTDMTGIGSNMQLRLHRGGVHSVAQLWATSPKQLRKLWGSVQGERMWYWLHGYDLPETESGEKAVVGHSRVLAPDQRPPPQAHIIARRLLLKAAMRLRRYELNCAQMTLSVRTPFSTRWYGERKLTRTDDSFVLLNELRALWNEMGVQLKPALIKKISVNLLSLQPQGSAAPDLFATPAKVSKRSELLKKLDALNRRYGKDTVTIGAMQPDIVETKIAFSRIPERAEFLE